MDPKKHSTDEAIPLHEDLTELEAIISDPAEFSLETSELEPEPPSSPTVSPPAEEENWKDKYLRLYAEFDNFRKRTQREKEHLVLTAGEQLMLALLPTLDDLDRALKAAETSENLDKLKEGVQLLHRKLTAALQRQGVEAFGTSGDALDADLHEVIASLPVSEPEKRGQLIDVVERGYRYRGRVIRFAKVVTGAE